MGRVSDSSDEAFHRFTGVCRFCGALRDSTGLYSRPLDIRDGIDFDLHAPERLYNPLDFPSWDKESGWPGNVNLAERTATYFKRDFNPDDAWLTSTRVATRFDLLIHYPSRRATRSLLEIEHLIDAVKKDGMTVGVLGSPEDKDWLSIPCCSVETPTFNDLAETINSCGVFYGAASSPFALASGLKINRLVDIQPHCRNVLPLGTKGIDTTPLSIHEIHQAIRRIASIVPS